MTRQAQLASQIAIKVGGTDLQQSVLAQLVRVVVDQHSHLPGMFSICLFDPGLRLLDGGPFDLTKEVEISAQTVDGEDIVLIKGEITALEPDFGEAMIAGLLVRGYDRSHRLYRETKRAAFLNKKDSDLAQEIARAAELQAEVESTQIVYDHVYQHNLPDLAFLMKRAWRIGYECFVEEGKLYFRKPPSGSGGLTLTWGQDLLSFRPRLTLAEQVDEVVVKGWDVEKKAAIVGRAQQGKLYPEIEEPKKGAEWAASFGTGKLVIVDQPVASQAEADLLAAARLDEMSGAFVQAEGVAWRRPDVRAGRMVTLQALGERFSGTYLVTSATHVYDNQGHRTTFVVSGSRTGLLSEQLRPRSADRWPGVVTAVVTNTDDPNDWGRVKVKFPWMSEEAESDWARVVGLGAGPEAGFYSMPDVDDEVLVAFAHGDFSQPFVLGGVWNGANALPPEGAAAGRGEKPLVRTWHSRTGHWMAMYDNADNKTEIVTAGGHSLILDDANHKITISSSGGLVIEMDDNGGKIRIESSSEIQLKSSGNMKLEATGNLDLKGLQLNLEGTAKASLKAPTVTVEGSALAEVKGGLLKLN